MNSFALGGYSELELERSSTLIDFSPPGIGLSVFFCSKLTGLSLT
jgi:hypothetical protein